LANLTQGLRHDDGRRDRLLLAHRLSHQIPFLWRFHAIHHSAEQLDFLVNTRMHPVDLVWSRMIMLTPIFALGLANPLHFGEGLIATTVLLSGSMWGYFIHSNIRWRLGRSNGC
jgi:sterol desaturase/sphingolipid hydroxylase (fatty acid hydroxylase superfamily)